VTATLHALGCGRSAGVYYTEDPNREARPKSRDNYYTRDGSGTWWSSGSSLVRSGASIDKETFRDLCGGFNPRTGKRLVRGAGKRHRAGWDITFSTPKSFGILWAAGNAKQRAVLEKIQQDAVDQALQLLVGERLVEVRLGAGGHRCEIPDDIIVAKFAHFTSREGDPTCHVHCILINVAGAFGKYLTVEPKKAFQAQLLLGAAMRCALAERLVELGLSLKEAGRDQFEIAGIPESMIEAFAKRARQIKAAVGRDASAAQKEVAALATRRDKSSVPTDADLESRWRQELAHFEIDPWMVAQEAHLVRGQRRDSDRDHDYDPPEIAGDTPVTLAASAVLRTENVLTRKVLLHRSFVESTLQGKGLKPVYSEISHLEKSGKLIRLDDRDMTQHWTTKAIAAEEAALCRLAKERVLSSLFRPEAVELALQSAPFLSEEQREAIRRATSSDPTVVLEAGAGTGKTAINSVLAHAAKLSGGVKLLCLAPSWIAADECARSTGAEALSIARFRHELATGKRQAPGADTICIIDEAGMVSVRDLAAIFEALTLRNAAGAPARSCKILLSGDRRQLASVAGGSALKAVSDIIERRGTLTAVRRQFVDWQRIASTIMAQGASEAGLRTYAEHGRIELIAGREAALTKTIQDWRDLRRSHGDDVIIVTRRNRHAAELNRAARDMLRAEGLIVGNDVVLPAIDREGEPVPLSIAIGDRIRFGETLHKHKVRNGTRGTVEKYVLDIDGSVRLTICLEDNRQIEDTWSGFAQESRRRHRGIPKLVHSIAGSAYSVQGRTAAATVHYIAEPTNAREVYVGLTRHRHEARIVVESERLDAACRARQVDPRMSPTKSALLECLFEEASRYSEKSNVVDHVVDRAKFIESGSVELPRQQSYFSMASVAEAARRVELAARTLNLNGSWLIGKLRRRTLLMMPDKIMVESTRTIIEKVKAWIRVPNSSTELGYPHRSTAFEYDR
jgi:conjugative relaxase-like TrwC/TraI family protein